MENVVIEVLKKENERLIQKHRDAYYKLLGLLIDLDVDVISPLEQMSPELVEKLREYYEKVSDTLHINRPEEDDICQPILPHVKLWLVKDNLSTLEITTPFLSQLQNEEGLLSFKEKLRNLGGPKHRMFIINLCCGRNSYCLYSVHIDDLEAAIEGFCTKLEVALRLVHTNLIKE